MYTEGVIEGQGLSLTVKISVELPQRRVPRLPVPDRLKFDVVSWDHNQKIPTGGGYILKLMGRSIAMTFDGNYWTPLYD